MRQRARVTALNRKSSAASLGARNSTLGVAEAGDAALGRVSLTEALAGCAFGASVSVERKGYPAVFDDWSYVYIRSTKSGFYLRQPRMRDPFTGVGAEAHVTELPFRHVFATLRTRRRCQTGQPLRAAGQKGP